VLGNKPSLAPEKPTLTFKTSMHYHIEWSSTGLGSESFNSYAEAHEAAHLVVEDDRSSQATARPLPPLNETFSVELFNEECPVCAKYGGAR
jgi:hypothetical protein